MLSIWEGLKWIVKEGVEFVAKIMGVPDANNNSILDNIKGIIGQIPNKIEDLMIGFNRLKEWHERVKMQLAGMNPKNWLGNTEALGKTILNVPSWFKDRKQKYRDKAPWYKRNYELFKKANPNSKLSYEEWAAQELGISVEAFLKITPSRPLGSNLSEKMFGAPGSQERIESEKGSSDLNRLFGHEESSLPIDKNIKIASLVGNDSTTQVVTVPVPIPSRTSVKVGSLQTVVVPLLNNTADIASKLYQYELTKVG